MNKVSIINNMFILKYLYLEIKEEQEIKSDKEINKDKKDEKNIEANKEEIKIDENDKKNEENDIKNENNKKENNENKEPGKENENQIIDSNRKIIENDIKDAPTLTLEEIECNLLNGQKITINAQGMVGGRGLNDGVTIFGSASNLYQSENSNFNVINSSVNTNFIKSDFILNLKEKYNYPYIFMIYFEKESKSYLIRPYSSKNNDNRILYILLTNGYNLPLKQREIFSAGNIIFQANPIENNNLEITNLSKQELSMIPKQIFNASSKKEVTIGRNKDCDFSFPGNKSFSRIQTTFEFDEENQVWIIKDGSKTKSSTNGTWVFCTHSFPIKDKMIIEILNNRIQISEEIKSE